MTALVKMPAGMSVSSMSVWANTVVTCSLLNVTDFQNVVQIRVLVSALVQDCDCEWCDDGGYARVEVVVERMARDTLRPLGRELVTLVPMEDEDAWCTLDGVQANRALGKRIDWLVAQARAVVCPPESEGVL